MAEDPTLAQIDAAINALGYGTEAYHEALAMYCMMLARSQWRLADLARRRRSTRGRKQDGHPA